VRIEELATVIGTEFSTRKFSPIVERIDIRIAAHCVGDEPPASIGSVFATLAQEMHTPVLARDDAASVDRRLGKHEQQVGALASKEHECDPRGAE